MYYILYPILYIFSLLPLRILYFISDALYGIIYYVIGYRKKVVLQNLLTAFPLKTEQERVRIAKDFYHRFIDSLIESIKLLSAPLSFFDKHFTGNWEVLNQFHQSGKSVQLHLGHNFNWEWGNAILPKKVKIPVLGVYMPISNKSFDRLFRKMRSRGGARLLSAHRMAKDFLPYRKTQYCLALIADQNPPNMRQAGWFDFFNRKTAFTTGPAKNAINNNSVVLFAFITRPKRGYYKVLFSVAEENPAATTEHELTAKFVNYLENVIQENPPMWLWSHRRWRRKWPGEQTITG